MNAPATASRPTTTTHTLMHPTAVKKVEFRPEGDVVRVRTFDGPWCRSELRLTRNEARIHWTLLLRSGFERF